MLGADAESFAESGDPFLAALKGRDLPTDLATRDILASLSGEHGNNDLLFAKAMANQSLFVVDGCNLRVYTEPPGIYDLLSLYPANEAVSMATFMTTHLRPEFLRYVKINSTPQGVYSWLLNCPMFHRDMPETDIFAVALKNGVYKLDTGKLKPFSPKYGLQFSVNANYTEDDCLPPEVESVFLTLGGGEEGAEQLFAVIGIAISNYRSLQKAAYIYGETGTGKGTLERFMKHVMMQPGAYHGLDLRDLANDFAPAQLENCLFSISPDLTKRQFSDKSLAVFKKLTGQDTFETQKKHIQHTVMTPKTFLIFLANFAPKIAANFDETGELKRRFWLIRTGNKPEKAIPQHELAAMLDKYRDVIVSRALRTASRFIANPELIWEPSDDDLYDYAPPADVNSDISKFVENHIRATGNSMDFVSSDKLYDAYGAVCRAAGKEPEVTKEGFASRIAPYLRQTVKGRKNGVRGYKKIKLV
jgi:phage/plasmid-associated DNA primase